MASALTGAAAFVLPFTPFGQRYFAFAALPGSLVLLIVAVLAVYVLAAEIAKRRYYYRHAG
jgi:hypothetical protein